jgi:SAM-dependent methyltransferase
MNPLVLLRELSLLKGNKTVLDVGTKNGFIASQFAELGMEVDAFDINDPKEEIAKVNFQKIGVRDFLESNTKTYHITVCRHVLHHLDKPKEIIEELNKISGIFLFTYFGPKDDWSDKVSTLTHEDVLGLFVPEKIRHHSETFQYGKTYAQEMKFWHINTFVIKND